MWIYIKEVWIGKGCDVKGIWHKTKYTASDWQWGPLQTEAKKQNVKVLNLLCLISQTYRNFSTFLWKPPLAYFTFLSFFFCSFSRNNFILRKQSWGFRQFLHLSRANEEFCSHREKYFSHHEIDVVIMKKMGNVALPVKFQSTFILFSFFLVFGSFKPKICLLTCFSPQP